MRVLLLFAAAAVSALAAAAPAPAATVPITIRHQVKGCHAWAVAGSPYRASQTLTVRARTTLTVVNHDVMPHTLVQLAGPRLALVHPLMGHMGAKTTFVLLNPGVYRFKTRAGEDYPGMGEMKTIGEDNVLRLTIVVK